MTLESKAVCASAVFSLLAALVLAAQLYLAERERRYERGQIQYLGLLSREDRTDKFGTLRLKQVSGEPYLIEKVALTPSVPDKLGLYVEGGTFDISVLPYLSGDNQLPEFVIPNIGQLICHKNLKMGTEACDPTARFTIRYDYEVFEEIRQNKEVLRAPEY